jgi:dTDP-4-amino-4,6-dideoxygalactose transaminase
MGKGTEIREQYLPFGRPDIGEQEVEAVSRVLRSGWIGMGSETLAFEQELAAMLGAEHVVTVNSCTSGLFLALKAAGIGPGDEVICPSLTWCSTANAALYLGATPVLCDVDMKTLSATPELVAAKLGPKTRAVMVVHMGGRAVDVQAIRQAVPESVAIIEDAAHALGSRFPDGSPVGSSGNLTCFSFYANKNLSTGEGGAIATSDADLADRLRSLRLHGLPSDAWSRFVNPRAALGFDIQELGYKMNYTDLQAAIGRVQLRRQPEFHEVRQRIALRYLKALPDIHPGIRWQSEIDHAHHARHLFQIIFPESGLAKSRDQILLELRDRKIGASIHYTPLHRMTLYKPYASMLGNTDSLANRIMTLPIGAAISDGDVDYIIENLREVVQ